MVLRTKVGQRVASQSWIFNSLLWFKIGPSYLSSSLIRTRTYLVVICMKFIWSLNPLKNVSHVHINITDTWNFSMLSFVILELIRSLIGKFQSKRKSDRVWSSRVHCVLSSIDRVILILYRSVSQSFKSRDHLLLQSSDVWFWFEGVTRGRKKNIKGSTWERINASSTFHKYWRDRLLSTWMLLLRLWIERWKVHQFIISL